MSLGYVVARSFFSSESTPQYFAGLQATFQYEAQFIFSLRVIAMKLNVLTFQFPHDLKLGWVTYVFLWFVKCHVFRFVNIQIQTICHKSIIDFEEFPID